MIFNGKFANFQDFSLDFCQQADFLQSVGTLLFIILICDVFCVLSIIIALPQDQSNSCSLYTMSELYPSMKSILASTSSSAQVSSWPPPTLARCNYYYNISDHGCVIVAVKYFQTEGAINILEYSFLMWYQH